MFNWAQTFQLTKCSPILTSVCLGYMAIQEPKHPLNLNGNLTCICLPSSAEFLFKEWNWTLWGSKINVFSCKSDRDIEKKICTERNDFFIFHIPTSAVTDKLSNYALFKNQLIFVAWINEYRWPYTSLCKWHIWLIETIIF